jgi:hypothetical protein
MQIAQIVIAINDPEVLIASREVKDLFVYRKNNQSGKPDFCPDRNDVGLGVFDNASRNIGARQRERKKENDNAKGVVKERFHG